MRIERDSSAPLRARVTALGRLVGDVLLAYARPGTFEYVERLRALTRRARSEPGSIDEAQSDRGPLERVSRSQQCYSSNGWSQSRCPARRGCRSP